MFLEFGTINNKILILFLYPIFIKIRNLILPLINDNIIFDVFRFYLSLVFSIIFTIIIYKRTKIIDKINEPNEKNNESNSSIEIAKSDIEWINPLKIKEQTENKMKKRKKIIFIILLVFIGLIANIFYIIFHNLFREDHEIPVLALEIGRQSIGTFFEIIFFLIFGISILNNKIYKHHLVSLIILIFNLIIMFISYTIYFRMITLKIILYYFLYDFFFCLSYILGKKYLDMFYGKPFSLMVYIGSITSIILFIYDIISFAIIHDEDNNVNGIILGIKNNFNLSFIFIILDILFYFITNIGIWLTIYFFTPFHFIISESISEYIYLTYDYFSGTNYKKSDVIIYSLIYIINIFFSLVFNEIIILNFCNMNYNTKKYIERREREEMENYMNLGPIIDPINTEN